MKTVKLVSLFAILCLVNSCVSKSIVANDFNEKINGEIGINILIPSNTDKYQKLLGEQLTAEFKKRNINASVNYGYEKNSNKKFTLNIVLKYTTYDKGLYEIENEVSLVYNPDQKKVWQTKDKAFIRNKILLANVDLSEKAAEKSTKNIITKLIKDGLL